MQEHYHADAHGWQRSFLPLTALIFIDADPNKTSEQQRSDATQKARQALKNYWVAMEGTIDPEKIEQAIGNALVGNPSDIIEQIKERFHPDDRIMLWFDFNNHNSQDVCKSMRYFWESVGPYV